MQSPLFPPHTLHYACPVLLDMWMYDVISFPSWESLYAAGELWDTMKPHCYQSMVHLLLEHNMWNWQVQHSPTWIHPYLALTNICVDERTAAYHRYSRHHDRLWLCSSWVPPVFSIPRLLVAVKKGWYMKLKAFETQLILNVNPSF